MLIEYKGHRIFAFSDTHGMYRRLTVPADADILICADDACEGFNPVDLEDFLEWYLTILTKLRFIVPGNLDGVIDFGVFYTLNHAMSNISIKVSGKICGKMAVTFDIKSSK